MTFDKRKRTKEECKGPNKGRKQNRRKEKKMRGKK
jgi:hypothetical protein